MNDETFVSGGITNASPFLWLFSKMKRINTASGIGHDVAILGGDVSNPYLLNDYQTNLDDYTKEVSDFLFVI
jgi:hypothetical protein